MRGVRHWKTVIAQDLLIMSSLMLLLLVSNGEIDGAPALPKNLHAFGSTSVDGGTKITQNGYFTKLLAMIPWWRICISAQNCHWRQIVVSPFWTREQMVEQQWKHVDSLPPKISKAIHTSSNKVMLIFSSMCINVQHYQTTLQKLRSIIKAKCPWMLLNGIIYQHDNDRQQRPS